VVLFFIACVGSCLLQCCVVCMGLWFAVLVIDVRVHVVGGVFVVVLCSLVG